jgi:hypothetical protein
VPSYDFSGPFVAARILDDEGNIFPLWTDTARSASTFSSDSEIEIGALAFLQTVTVELNLAALPKISANLSPTFKEGLRFIDSKLADSGGANFIEVQLGYTGGVGESASAVLSPVFGGMLLNPEISISEDISITLNAQGTGGFSMVRQTGTRSARDGESRRDLITRIARGPNAARQLTLDFSSPDEENGEAKQLLDEPVSYTQGGRSDWFALWELANSCRCWMLLVGDELRFLSRSQALRGDPTRILRLYNYPGGRLGGLTNDPNSQDSEVGIYPIISFDSPTNAVYLPGSVRGIVMEDVSETTREATREDVTDATVERVQSAPGPSGPGDERVMPPPEEDTGDGGERLPGDPANREALQSARAEFRRGGNLGIQLEIETIGIPDIFPGEVVQVRGVGARFERHNYGVHKVTHNIGVGGFTTNLTLVSSTDSLLQTGESSSAEANTREARPQSDDQVTATPDRNQAVS